MPAVDELTAYLQTQSQGTVGTDLFEHQLPASPDVATAVRQFGGSRSVVRSGGVLAETVMIRVECRHTSRSAAETKAYTVLSKMEFPQLGNVTLSGVRYYSGRVTRPPGPLQVDQTNLRFTFYFEMEILKARS